MLSWLRRRRDQAERIEAEADALISNLGDGAYSEPRRRAREASSDEMEREWSRVALAIARKTGKHVGLDTATRMAMEADFSGAEDATEARSEPLEDIDPSTSSCGSCRRPLPGRPAGFSSSAAEPRAGH
jgi:hypothetical protein